jgi:hypothetical protein
VVVLHQSSKLFVFIVIKILRHGLNLVPLALFQKLVNWIVEWMSVMKHTAITIIIMQQIQYQAE